MATKVYKTFKELEPHIGMTCKMDDQRTLYFVRSDSYQNLFSIYSKLASTDSVTLTSSEFTLERGDSWREFKVLSPTMVLLLSRGRHLYLAYENSDGGFDVNSFDAQIFEYLNKNWDPNRLARLREPNDPNTLRQKGLSLIRAGKDFDFEIISKEGTSIPVHSLVLKALWPFFDKMLESNMAEKEEKKLKLPYPLLWIEAMVSYFYGENKKLQYEEATGLLVLCGVYDIPELCQIASSCITTEPLDMIKCLKGWRRAFEGNCEEMRMYLGNYYYQNLGSVSKYEQLLCDFSQQEAVQLMVDASKSQMKPQVVTTK